MPKIDKPKIPKLSLPEIYALADEYEVAQEREASAKRDKSDAQRTLVENVWRRMKQKTIESAAFGQFTRITVVANTRVNYDEGGLWKALKPSQRRKAFDANINLNALSGEARKRVLGVLSKDELADVTTYTLNTDRLSAAVQEGKIQAKTVADHSSIVESEPYVRISHGSGE